MLKILGFLFIAVGIFLCLTVFLIPIGGPSIGLGCLMLIASALMKRRDVIVYVDRYSDKPPEPRGVSNSMFGR